MSRSPLRLADGFYCQVLFVLLLHTSIADAMSKPVDPDADGRHHARPEAVAVALAAGVDLDGRLDDEIWGLAPVAGGFSEFEPDRGGPSSAATFFQVAHDEHAVYFAIVCLDDRVSSTLSRRDNIANSDYVDIHLDPYGDRTTGYLFRINPHGVLADGTIFDDGVMDMDWDTVWEAECVRDDDGWTAEVRIPFSALRIRAGAPWWGLQVGRYRHATGEEDAWTCWSREQYGFVSRFGLLVGLDEVEPVRRIEVLPYAVMRVEDPAGDEDFSDEVDAMATVGADLRCGLTSNFTLNATLQPDFGQVEVDPAELNLSPYETFFAEKRPFFVEGAGYFAHPDFDLFYTRRIGLGHENARIRGAAKVLGKTAGGCSVGLLVASTDVTGDDQAHNPLKSGRDGRYYAVSRIGQDFADGAHSVHLMGTATGLGVTERPEAVTGGVDFDCNFRDRAWNVSGSLIGSDVGTIGDDERLQGVGATFNLSEVAGAWQGGASGRLEDDTLELNNLGYLRDPNRIEAGGWLEYDYHAKDADEAINLVATRLDFQKSWIAGGRTVRDISDPEHILWSYDAGHHREFWFEASSRLRHRNFWSADLSLYYGLAYTLPTASRQTNEYGAGPLVNGPPEYGFTLGGSTDPRRRFSGSLHLNLYAGDEGNRDAFLIGRVGWNQSPRLNHELRFSIIDSRHVRQHLMNTSWAEGEGIGGIHYLFAELRRDIWDLTLRSNLLFGRNTSLELYLQPYLTRGNYRDAKELVEPDSDNFRSWSESGFDVNDWDILVGSVNFKAVFRWQYRRGSTFFLAWTHSRFRADQRWMGGDEDLFDGGLIGTIPEAWLQQEPENVILAKITWWLNL